MSAESKRPEFDQMTRWESSVAEVLRQNMPLVGIDDDDSQMLWCEIVDDMITLFSTQKPRFDRERFYTYCLGGEGVVSL